jgi:hypothetical protein
VLALALFAVGCADNDNEEATVTRTVVRIDADGNPEVHTYEVTVAEQLDLVA